MNIVIIGNPRTNNESIKSIADSFTEAGISIRYPTADSVEQNSATETFERIDWSNFVIAVPKDDLNFDFATTIYLAYARHVNKPVFIFYS